MLSSSPLTHSVADVTQYPQWKAMLFDLFSVAAIYLGVSLLVVLLSTCAWLYVAPSGMIPALEKRKKSNVGRLNFRLIFWYALLILGASLLVPADAAKRSRITTTTASFSSNTGSGKQKRRKRAPPSPPNKRATSSSAKKRTTSSPSSTKNNASATSSLPRFNKPHHFDEDNFKKQFDTPKKHIAMMMFLLNGEFDEYSIMYYLQQYLFWFLSVDQSNFDKAEYIAMETRLAELIRAALSLGGKYVINLGDGIREGVLLLVLKHYAPWSCSKWKCIWGCTFNFISRTNVCIIAFITVLPRILIQVCGYEWKESFRETLIQVVAFLDANPVLPNCPNRKSHSFFKAYAEEAFSGFGIPVDSKDDNVFDCMDFLYFITYLRFLAFAKFSKLSSQSILRVIVASAETRKRWFSVRLTDLKLQTHWIIAGFLAHGQCWMMRLPLFNRLVHPLEFLEKYSKTLRLCYSIVIAAVLNVSVAEIDDKLQDNTIGQSYGRVKEIPMRFEILSLREREITDYVKGSATKVNNATLVPTSSNSGKRKHPP
jgi:hypothetical protein